MKLLFSYVLLFIAAIIQISVLPHIPILNVANILLVLAILFAFYFSDYRHIAIFAFFSGFVADIYSASPFGVVLLSFVFAIFLIDFLAKNFFGKADLLVIIAGAAVGSILYSGFYFGFLKIYEILKIAPHFNYIVAFSPKIIALSIVSNIIMIAVFYLPMKKFVYSVVRFEK